MLYLPYQGSDRCLHPLPLLPLPQCFAIRSHQSTFSLSYWENDVAFITLSIILQSFSPASPCFVYLTKCHAIANHKTNSCNFFNLLPKMMSSTPAACLWSFSYSRSRTIPYQEPQLLSVILSSMPLPSSLVSLLGTKLVYCPFYPLHKTKLIL